MGEITPQPTGRQPGAERPQKDRRSQPRQSVIPQGTRQPSSENGPDAQPLEAAYWRDPGVLGGELHLQDGFCLPFSHSLDFKVWDFHAGGLCILLAPSAELPTGTAVEVRLRDRTGPLGDLIQAQIRWQVQVSSTRFCGLAFASPISEGPFFERYILMGDQEPLAA